MNVQQRGFGGVDAVAQRLVDVVEVVYPLGVPKIDDQVSARETLAVALDKEILALISLGGDLSSDILFFRFGGAWVFIQVDPQLEEGVCLCHRSSNATSRLTQYN